MRPLLLGLLVLAACSDASSDVATIGPRTAPTTTTGSTPAPAPKDGGAPAGPHTPNEALRRCAESPASVGSIAQAVAHLNTLIEKGGDGPCFVASLKRPLSVVATTGVTSAQPAGGRGAPRLFFMLPNVVISAVPDGDGSKLLEFGEWSGSRKTLKGEIALPVTTPLGADGPFTRVLQGTDRTVCATCHREEERHPTIPNAFVSVAYKPEPGTFVAFEDLEELHNLCVRAKDDTGRRCSMIHALFDFGEVTDGAFPPTVETFFKQ